MPEFVSEKRIQLAVKEGFDRMARFSKSRAMFVKQYVGHHYNQGTSLTDKEPINMIFHVIRALVPSYIIRNPVNKVVTNIKEYEDYAYLLGLALDTINDRIKLKNVIRRAIVDSFFAMGIVKTGLSATDQLIEFGDIRIDPGQVYADNVSFDDFVIDPTCKKLEEAAFVGHRSRVPRQLLLDWDRYDHDLVMKLPRSTHNDAKKKAASLTQSNISNQEMYELQDFVDIVELYIPEANTLIVIPDPNQIMFDKYLRIDDFYGPKSGPYRYLTLTQPVPDNPFPIAPVGIWFDLHILANKLMCKQMDRSERQKSVLVADPSGADLAEDIREAEDSEVLYGDPSSVKPFTVGGVDEGTNGMLNSLQTWINYMAGNPDQMAGISSEAETATQSMILQGNATVTLEDSKNTIYEFTSDINRDMAWFLHYDPLINIPLVTRKRSWYDGGAFDFGTQITLTSEQRRGEHFDFSFKIKPKSMSPIDPIILSKRIFEFATNVIPALVNSASMMWSIGQPFNLQRAITDMAEQFGLDEFVSDWFDDPEFMNRIAIMTALGPKPEGKGQSSGMAGVLQNKGSPSTVNFDTGTVNAQAQELAGIMQSATKGSMRGTPATRGPALEGM
jgi:hypothetical protein